MLLKFTPVEPIFTPFKGRNGVTSAQTHYKLYTFWFCEARQVIWYFICWNWCIFEIVPPLTLFLPLFTPKIVNKNIAQGCQSGTRLILDQDTLNYHFHQKNCISTPTYTSAVFLVSSSLLFWLWCDFVDCCSCLLFCYPQYISFGC